MSEFENDTELIVRLTDAVKRQREENSGIQRKLEEQRATITVALGYIRAGRADLAGLVLGCDNRVGEVAP